MFKSLLPFLGGSVGCALVFSLSLLNFYHRQQLETYLEATTQTHATIVGAADGVHGSIIFEPDGFFILAPRLQPMVFLPEKNALIKISHGSSPVQTKAQFVNSHALHLELRRVFTLLLGQSLLIILLVAGFLFLFLRKTFLRPLNLLLQNIHSVSAHPERASLSKPQKNKTPFDAAHASLYGMAHALQKKTKSQAQLAAAGLAASKISHDLRGLLGNAILITEAMATTDQNAKKISRLTGSLSRAEKLCAQYLNHTATHAAAPLAKTFVLSDLLEEVRAELALTKKFIWEDYTDNTLTSDPDVLFRLLFNLSKNALTAGATTLTLRSEQSAQRAGETTLTLEDNGTGLPLRVRANLFMPFVESASGSTGLGLSIAQDLARNLGGTLRLDQTSQHGTRFRLTLPHAER